MRLGYNARLTYTNYFRLGHTSREGLIVVQGADCLVQEAQPNWSPQNNEQNTSRT